MVDVSTYLCKATGILSDYQWVYNFHATHLLANEVLSRIPSEWTQALLSLSDEDLSLINSGIIKDGWPSCLAEFVQRCEEIILPMDLVSQSKRWNYIPAEIRKGMSPKKQHEVLHLASFIHNQCHESRLSRIIDLGSGLGYLGKLLHHCGGYQVLGLEADERCVGRAMSMQQPICSSGVKHVALTLRPAHKEEVWTTTVEEVRNALMDPSNWEGGCSCGRGRRTVNNPVGGSEETEMPTLSHENVLHDKRSQKTFDQNVCMVSLHSCGDLSPTALRLFLELPQVKRLVVMSCCYHKMKSIQVDRCRAMPECPAEDQTAGISGSDFPNAHSAKADREESRTRRNRSTEKKKSRSTSSDDNDDRSPASRPTRKERSGDQTSRSRNKSESHHKVSSEDHVKEVFPDFPMSTELERLVFARRGFLRRPLLRLASEMTVEMWRLMTAKQRNERSVHVMGRAVLELYAKRERYKLKKMRRRGVRKAHRTNFDDYIEDALLRFEFIPNPSKRLGIRPLIEAESDDCEVGEGRLPNSSREVVRDTGGSHSMEGSAATDSDPKGLRSRKLEGGISGSSPSSYHRVDTLAGGVGDEENGLGVHAIDIPFIDDEDSEVQPRDSSAQTQQFFSDNGEASASSPIEEHRRKLKHLTEEQCTPEVMRLTTALYTLQAAIQSVAEGIVIADRLAFLLERREPSLVEASLVRVFDRSISPRSLAIVALKTSHVKNDNK